VKTDNKYLDGEYLVNNPSWDREDSPWKAAQVSNILKSNLITPNSICEVGCGSGDVLECLGNLFPKSDLFGFDISPQAASFWEPNKCVSRVRFTLGDFHTLNTVVYDVLLLLDVIEHVRDPFTFLENMRSHAQKFVLHIPLDLSAFSVMRSTPLLRARRQVGHLHSYTKDLALETLKDCGFSVLDWRYTDACLNMPNRSLKTKLSRWPRKVFYALNKDFGVSLLGGNTLIVLAE